jgi:hypothetical protein
MIAVGTVARLVVAFKTAGVTFDVASFKVVDHSLRLHGFDVYGHIQGNPARGQPDIGRYPYPPGWFPLILLTGSISNHTFAFRDVIQIWPILADAAIAWLVQDYLRLRGAGERTRLIAAGAVALGPSFAVVSGFHGQFDSLAILPAVGGLYVWQRMGPSTRTAAIAGALIGLGAALKTVPILMLLALLPACRSWRQAVALGAAAVAVPALALLPFFIADPSGLHDVFHYRGVAALGGLGLAVQPDLVKSWLNATPVPANGLAVDVITHQTLILAVVLAAVAAVLARCRPHPAVAATMIWLAVFAFSANFQLSYFVWGLPFLLMAGFVWQTIALEAVLLIPTVIRYWVFYKGYWHDGDIYLLYSPFLIAVILASAAGLVALAAACLRGRAGPDGGSAAQPAPQWGN